MLLLLLLLSNRGVTPLDLYNIPLDGSVTITLPANLLSKSVPFNVKIVLWP